MKAGGGKLQGVHAVKYKTQCGNGSQITNGYAPIHISHEDQGYTAKDDILPDRFYQNFKTGPLKDTPYTKEGMDRAQELYYQMAGWDPELGIPTEGKFHELDLGWVADELKATIKK